MPHALHSPFIGGNNVGGGSVVGTAGIENETHHQKIIRWFWYDMGMKICKKPCLNIQQSGILRGHIVSKSSQQSPKDLQLSSQ